MKRIRYFWSKQISARRHGEKKINFFPFNRYPNGENYLLRSYQIHSFKPQDLNLYIYLLQVLSDGKTYGVTKLIDETLFRCNFDSYDAGIFYPMMSRKLEEMTAAGLLIRQRKSSYRLAPDILQDFSSEELLHLYRILFLYRETLPLSSVDSQLHEIDFIASAQEVHFLKRLEAEKRFGEVKYLDKNHCLFSVELFNPNEIIPWIRSFGHVASVRASEKHNLHEKLERDWSETLANYLEPAKATEITASNYPPSKKFSTNDLPTTNAEQPEFFSEFRNAFYRAVLCAYNEILSLGKAVVIDEPLSIRDKIIYELKTRCEKLPKYNQKDAEQ